jgi:Fic family protein
MASQNYWLMEYISISKIIKNAPAQYSKAYLETETDASDVTYFIIHQLEVIKQAIEELHEYLSEKQAEIEYAENLTSHNPQLKDKLNYRQLSVLKHALKHPGFTYKIAQHQNSHGITYETARKDLLTMADKLKLLLKVKEGRAFVFIAPSDLRKRIVKGAGSRG